MDPARQTGPPIDPHIQISLRLGPTVEIIPRKQKIPLGDRIQSVALDRLECLVEAASQRDRPGHLARANLGIEKPRNRFHARDHIHRQAAGALSARCGGVSLSPMIVPIPGTRSIAHLEENVAALQVPLTAADAAAL
ncbi:hypothetical protein [Prosthecodimorpha staleyi]|uniref:hypothetical protein n=1 Tax=Prosthecodimorpha staleyi TaxID=2840188 RepID=UPI0021C3D83F|nr:hypothetical protein [Prosthecodimorpha staleyi]